MLSKSVQNKIRRLEKTLFSLPVKTLTVTDQKFWYREGSGRGEVWDCALLQKFFLKIMLK